MAFHQMEGGQEELRGLFQKFRSKRAKRKEKALLQGKKPGKRDSHEEDEEAARIKLEEEIRHEYVQTIECGRDKTQLINLDALPPGTL